MSTLSVPLTADLENALNLLVQNGVAPNKAAVARKAIEKLAEEAAVNAVLESEREAAEGKILRGDVQTLLKKIP